MTWKEPWVSCLTSVLNDFISYPNRDIRGSISMVVGCLQSSIRIPLHECTSRQPRQAPVTMGKNAQAPNGRSGSQMRLFIIIDKHPAFTQDMRAQGLLAQDNVLPGKGIGNRHMLREKFSRGGQAQVG